MDYGMIGKIEKARRYAEEPQRVTLKALHVAFQGDNNSYTIHLDDHGWQCSCPGFEQHRICPHIMTLEKLFRPMLKRDPLPYAPGQNVVSDVDKAKHYSEETDRIRVDTLEANFEGSNSAHEFGYNSGAWHCNCDFFHSRGTCCHTMAMERIMGDMLVAPAPVSVTTP